MKRKIVLAGGSGFLGRLICRHFSDTEVQFIILTRKVNPANATAPNITQLAWNGKDQGEWAASLDGAEAVINLSGRTVNCLYTTENKKQIIDSRVQSTVAIGIAINHCANPPRVWVNAGSAAIYGDGDDEQFTENSSYGDNFSAEVCKQWEESFNDMFTPLTRKVLLRIGLVLGTDGGLLEPFLLLAKLGLGGKQGGGRQYISWIHEHDFVKAIEFVLSQSELEGALNCTAPAPVTNAEFTAAISKTLHRPFQIPAMAWMIKIGGRVIGTEPDLILKGRRVLPQKLLQKGFIFEYDTLQKALKQLIEQK